MGVVEASLPLGVCWPSAIDVFHYLGGFSPPKLSISATFPFCVVVVDQGLLATILPNPTKLANCSLDFATSAVTDLVV